MSSTIKRPAHYARDYIAATIIVAAFYAAVYFGVQITSGQSTSGVVTGKRADIVFVPVDDYGSPSRWPDWVKNILAWRDVLDPTILFLPNQTYGFSIVYDGDFDRTAQNFERLEFGIEHQPLPSLSQASMSAGSDDFLEKMEYARLVLAPTIADAPVAMSRPQAILWTGRDGQPVQLLPELALPDALKDRSFTTNGTTRIVVHASGPMFPLAMRSRMSTYADNVQCTGRRFTITRSRSCGVTELDSLAVAHVTKWFNSAEAQTAMAEKAPAWLLDPAYFECHWRLLPTITENPQPEDREGWHDLDWY